MFLIASLIESFSFSHLGRFLPLFLGTLGTPARDIPTWTGILSASVWVFGLPLVLVALPVLLSLLNVERRHV